MNPADALRLSRANALAQKHGGHYTAILHAGDSSNAPVPITWYFSVEQLAALIDEATAAKDATIAGLRKEISDCAREAEREARDAYGQGQADESDRHRPDY